jgi:hypothetical protein
MSDLAKIRALTDQKAQIEAYRNVLATLTKKVFFPLFPLLVVCVCCVRGALELRCHVR